MVLDSSGRTLASHAFRRELDPALVSTLREEVLARARGASQRGFTPALSELAGRAIALPVPGGSHAAASSWLIAVPESENVAEFERFLAHHAVMVVALAQMRERVVARRAPPRRRRPQPRAGGASMPRTSRCAGAV